MSLSDSFSTSAAANYHDAFHFNKVSGPLLAKNYRSPLGKNRRDEITAMALMDLYGLELDFYSSTASQYLPETLSADSFSSRVLTAAKAHQSTLQEQGIAWNSQKNKLRNAVHQGWWEKFVHPSIFAGTLYPPEIFLYLVVADRLGLTEELGLTIDAFGKEIIAHPFKYILPNGVPISIWEAKLRQFSKKIRQAGTKPELYDKLSDLEQKRLLGFLLGRLSPNAYLMNIQQHVERNQSYSSYDLEWDHFNIQNEVLTRYLTGGLTIDRSSTCPQAGYVVTAREEEDFRTLKSAFFETPQRIHSEEFITHSWSSAIEFLIQLDDRQRKKLPDCFGIEPQLFRNLMQSFDGKAEYPPEVHNLLGCFAFVTGFFNEPERTMEARFNPDRQQTLNRITKGRYYRIYNLDIGDWEVFVTREENGTVTLLPNHPFNVGKELPVPPAEITAEPDAAPAVEDGTTHEELSESELFQQYCLQECFEILTPAIASFSSIQPKDQEGALARLATINQALGCLPRRFPSFMDRDFENIHNLIDPLLDSYGGTIPAPPPTDNPLEQLLNLSREFSSFIRISCLHAQIRETSDKLLAAFKALAETAGALEAQTEILKGMTPAAERIQTIFVDDLTKSQIALLARRVADNVTHPVKTWENNPVEEARPLDAQTQLSEVYFALAAKYFDALEEMQRTALLLAKRYSIGGTIINIIHQQDINLSEAALSKKLGETVQPTANPVELYDHPTRIKENLTHLWCVLGDLKVTHTAFASFAADRYGRHIFPETRIEGMLRVGKGGDIGQGIKNVTLPETMALLGIVQEIQRGDLIISRGQDTTALEIRYNPTAWAEKPGAVVQETHLAKTEVTIQHIIFPDKPNFVLAVMGGEATPVTCNRKAFLIPVISQSVSPLGQSVTP